MYWNTLNSFFDTDIDEDDSENVCRITKTLLTLDTMLNKRNDLSSEDEKVLKILIFTSLSII